MTTKFNKIVSEQMVLAAKKAYPSECCGILIGRIHENGTDKEIEVIEIREAPNQF
ncbi:MAG: Mov34/MPN/PAD-1 family protein, partial [Fibrobacter sp.]|nr:Mov34/MPN/PAD-1 family protein [Fibrobacter sp.]